jgi:hypothetical protein
MSDKMVNFFLFLTIVFQEKNERLFKTTNLYLKYVNFIFVTSHLNFTIVKTTKLSEYGFVCVTDVGCLRAGVCWGGSITVFV